MAHWLYWLRVAGVPITTKIASWGAVSVHIHAS